MVFYVGDQVKIAVSLTSGTNLNASGTAFWPGQVTSLEIKEDEGYYYQRYAGTASRDVNNQVLGPQTYSGKLKGNVQNFQWLKYALGSVAEVSGTTSLHTFIATNNNDSCPEVGGDSLPSFIVEASESVLIGASGQNFNRTLYGCFTNNLTITAAEGKEVMYEMDFIARAGSYQSGATVTITEDTNRPYLFSDVRLDNFGSSGTLLNNVKNITFSIANNLKTNHYVDADRTIGTPIPINRDYKVSLQMNANSTDIGSIYSIYFKPGSVFNTLFTGVITAASRTISICFSGCKINDFNGGLVREGPQEFNLGFTPKTVTAVESGLQLKYNNT